MNTLSDKAQELLGFLREEYKDSGYLYSGSWPYNSLTEKGFGKEVIHELEQSGKIQRRDCEDYALELSADERGRLVADHALVSAWYAKVGDAMLLDIQQEARRVSGVVEGKESGMVTVETMRSFGSVGAAEMDVYCPFTVGQVVEMEYDLPRRMQWAGYAARKASTGKAVGRFMVTNVVHNMLFSPGENMIEVQSLCEEFNKAYPRTRSLLVYENVLLKRVKEIDVSLDQKLQNAGAQSKEQAECDCVRDYEIEKE